jgi:DNA-directed RNA polymerase II subunit RPB1
MNIVDNNTGRPTEGGINDLRMGTVDKQLECQTCGCKFEHCPGHFGHIELARPVYHVGFVETCLKILRCVCYNCSALLLKPGDKNNKYNTIKKIKNPKKRQDMLYNASKTIKYCGIHNKDKDDNSNLFGNKEQIELMLKELEIDLKIRGEKLTIEQYAQISEYLNILLNQKL